MKPCSFEKSSNPAEVTQGERPRWDPASQGWVSQQDPAPDSAAQMTPAWDSSWKKALEGKGAAWNCGDRTGMSRCCPCVPPFLPSGARGSVLCSSVPTCGGRGLTKLLLGGRIALSSQAALMMPRSTHLGRRSGRVS